MTIKTYIIANWKSNKSAAETTAWFSAVAPALTAQARHTQSSQIEIILCVPFLYLSLASDAIARYRLPIRIAAQNVSPFPTGSYTGEIAASQLKDYATYVLLGHSERRQHFHETDEHIAKKAEQSSSAGITPIVCISDAQMTIPSHVSLVAYEPISAIGSGQPDNPVAANTVAQQVKQHPSVMSVLYGGSVTPENITSFLSQPDLDGVLVGKASLDPTSFCTLVAHASHR